jgi:hypothetical protein
VSSDPEATPETTKPSRFTLSRGLKLALAALMGVPTLVCAGVAWWWPRESSLRFEGAAPAEAHARAPVPLRKAVVLDQRGEPLEEPPVTNLSLSPAGLAMLEGGQLLPLRDGIVEVIATTDSGTRGSYTVRLELPPDYAGRWVSEARQGDITVTTFVTATRRAGDSYDNTAQVVFTRGSGAAEEVRGYALKNRVQLTRATLCEDNPILLPPDAPIPATSQCSRVVESRPDAIVLDSPEGGNFTLRRPGPEHDALLHRIVQRDLQRLQAAQLSWFQRFGAFRSSGTEMKAREAAAKGVRRYEPEANLVLLQWEPTPFVTNAGYWVQATATGFEARAYVDTDGDGKLASYVIRERGAVTRETHEQGH